MSTRTDLDTKKEKNLALVGNRTPFIHSVAVTIQTDLQSVMMILEFCCLEFIKFTSSKLRQIPYSVRLGYFSKQETDDELYSVY